MNLRMSMLALFLMILIFLSSSCTGKPAGDAQGSAQLTPEEQIQGTPIGSVKETVQEAVKSGEENVLLAEVLDSKGSYACTIRKGDEYIALTANDGMIREDILWDSQPIVSYLIDDKLYRYSIDYKAWAKFDYDPDSETSAYPYTSGILSHKELRNLTSGNALCIKQKIDDSLFIFPKEEAFDASDALRKIGSR